jgi:hypothetical protein
LGGFALVRVIFGNSPNQYIGIRRDPHRLPAQPRAAILLIFSIEGRTILSLQKTESIGNLAGRPRSFYLDTAVRKLVHGDLLAGIDTQMLQEILAQGNLSLGGYGKRTHGRVSFLVPRM